MPVADGRARKEALKAAFKAQGVDHVHYIAPLKTMMLVAVFGILSYNKKKEMEKNEDFSRLVENLGITSWADPHVQFRRDRTFVGGRSVHDYVPLYFGTHTPTQYRLTEKSSETQATDVVFAEVSLDRALDIDDIWYTDGNAASSDTSFYGDSSGVGSVDWNIVLRVPNCFSREYKRAKCAELLVPTEVPPDCIERFVFATQKIAEVFEEFTDEIAGIEALSCANDWEIACDKSHFYSIDSWGKLVPNA